MKIVATVWHWLSTSRYTRELEREIDALTLENDVLQRDNRQLLKALYPAMRFIQEEAQEVVSAKKTFRW